MANIIIGKPGEAGISLGEEGPQSVMVPTTEETIQEALNPRVTHGGGGGSSQAQAQAQAAQAKAAAEAKAAKEQRMIEEMRRAGLARIAAEQQTAAEKAQKQKQIIQAKATQTNNINQSSNLVLAPASGGVQIGSGSGSKKYYGNTFIPEFGMTANEYQRKIKQEAIDRGELDVKDYGRVGFSGYLSPKPEAQKEVITNVNQVNTS